jgi:hypothetical protein
MDKNLYSGNINIKDHFGVIFGGGVVLRGPAPVTALSKVQVCGRSPAEIVGSNPTGGMDVCL